MKRLGLALILACGFVFVTPALAVDFGVGVRAGTYGIGAELGAAFNDWFGIRAALSTGELSDDYEETGVVYDGTLKLGGYGVLADFYPMKGGFRVTAGILSNRNEVELEAVPTEPIEIGGGVYDPDEVGTLSGDIQFDDTVPYLGLGWGNVAKGKRLGFIADVGVVFQGSGQVTLTSSTGLIDPDDLAAEAQAIENDIADYDLWPVVSVGLAIRF